MKYRSEIDGLRAIAVLPVVLFHAGFEVFAGGFIGVDVFFVISGYLITSIIIFDLQKNRFSLLDFYERRARRILPALFFVVLSSVPLAWLLLLPSDMDDFYNSLVGVATFSSNIFFWLESGYFEAASELKPLLHTWSLAVEEQYYILFPIFLMISWRFGLRFILFILVITFFVSLAAAFWGSYNKPSATFYLLPTRAWELLIGAFVGILCHKYQLPTSNSIRNGLSILGIGAILYSIFIFNESTPFPGIYGLVPTLGTALVILFATPGTWVNFFLSFRVFVGIGLISYSIYLWHQPIFTFWRHYNLLEKTALQMVLLSALTMSLSYLTYRFIEKPFRLRSPFITRNQVFSLSILFMLVIITIGLIGNFGNFSKSITYPLDYEPDRGTLRSDSWNIIRELTGDKSLGVIGNSSEHTLWFKAEDLRHNLLIVGNSHSKDLFNVLHYSEETTRAFELARYGIQIRDIQEEFFNSENYQNADVIVIATQFTKNDYIRLKEISSKIIADEKVLAIALNIFEFFDTKRYTLADIQVLRCIRQPECDFKDLVKKINNAFFDDFKNGKESNRYFKSQKILNEIQKKKPNIILLDRMDYVCDNRNKKCYAIDERLNKYFYDYGHHTVTGSKFFASQIDKKNWIAPLIKAATTK